MIMRIPAALTIPLISVAALLLQQAYAAPAPLYAFGSTDSFTHAYVVQEFEAASGAFSNVVPITNGSFPWSFASTINTESHIMYVHFGKLSEDGESMFYAIDLDSHKVIDAVNIGVWSIESMHYDKDNGRIVAYGSLNETENLRDQKYYILTFPTKNYTDVKIIADVTTWFSAGCITALDSAGQIMYFIYLVPSAGTFAQRVLSFVSLQHPDAGPKNVSLVQYATAEWRTSSRAHYDPTTHKIALLMSYQGEYWSIAQLDVSTGVSSNTFIGVSNFYPYTSAYDEATRTFYTTGVADTGLLVTMDLANKNQTDYIIQKTNNYFNVALIEVL